MLAFAATSLALFVLQGDLPEGLEETYEITIELEGTLCVWAESEFGDPRITLTRVGDEESIEDDNSGGGTTAYIERAVHPGEEWVAIVRSAKADEVRFESSQVLESEVASAASQEALERLKQARVLEEEGDLNGARTLLVNAANELVDVCQSERSRAVDPAAVEIAIYAYQLGELKTCEALWSFVLEHRKQTMPRSHPERVVTAQDLGIVLLELKEVRAARAQFEEVVEVRQRVLPEDHVDLLVARGNLAITLKRMGDIAGARAHYEAVLAGFEKTLPEDHTNVLTARHNLAQALLQMGDLAGARALQESVLAARERTLGEDHHIVQRARLNLANTLHALGDLLGARDMYVGVLEALERLLPEDHPDLDHVRGNLAATMSKLGDLEGAHALQVAILESYERKLPEDSQSLLNARLNLASTKLRIGDHAGGRSLLESVLEARTEDLPEGHPDLLAARWNLGSAMWQAGDLLGARALFEKLLEAYEGSLPADHPNLAMVRQNLAVLKQEMGDLSGARALLEAALEVSQQQLPEDHPDLLAMRLNLGSTMRKMGDLSGARVLFESVLEARERTLPEDHPDLLLTRMNLATISLLMGELEEARAMFGSVLEARERTLPEGHLDLLSTRVNFAISLRAVGDLPGARVQLESALESYTHVLPEGHPNLLVAQDNLAGTLLEMGEPAAAREPARDLAAGMVRRLESLTLLSPREVREAAGGELNRLSLAVFLTETTQPEAPSALIYTLIETWRQAMSVSVLADVALTPELRERRSEILQMREDLNDLVAGGAQAGQAGESFAEQVSRISLERDRLERKLREGLVEHGVLAQPIEVQGVAAALPAGAAAIGFRRLRGFRLNKETKRIEPQQDRLLAHVVDAEGVLTKIDLGAADEIEGLATSWLAALGTRIERGAAPRQESDHEKEAGEVLRAHLLDPILESLSPKTKRLHVCLDEFLHLVPLDGLPLDEGRVGDRFEVVNESSFGRLVTARAPPKSEPSLLALGWPAFDAQLEGFEPKSDPAPIEAAQPRSGMRTDFAPLLQTRFEIEAMTTLFEEAFDREVPMLTRKEATKAAFHQNAPGKRFLHLATHGWFAPESVPSMLDEQEPGQLWMHASADETVKGLAPSTLCGLAFAGANHGRDAFGRVPGIMTAEELAGVDLSACDLAVLSACETNVGIRRAGQGIQSLQAALHAAGVRTAITSLWRIDDAATRSMMERFYTYLWVDGMGKAEALWKAKSDLRAEGHPVREWAAWVLSGDPD